MENRIFVTYFFLIHNEFKKLPTSTQYSIHDFGVFRKKTTCGKKTLENANSISRLPWLIASPCSSKGLINLHCLVSFRSRVANIAYRMISTVLFPHLGCKLQSDSTTSSLQVHSMHLLKTN